MIEDRIALAKAKRAELEALKQKLVQTEDAIQVDQTK